MPPVDAATQLFHFVFRDWHVDTKIRMLCMVLLDNPRIGAVAREDLEKMCI